MALWCAMLPPVETAIAGPHCEWCFYYPEDGGISESVRFGKIKMMAARIH